MTEKALKTAITKALVKCERELMRDIQRSLIVGKTDFPRGVLHGLRVSRRAINEVFKQQ